MKKRIALILFAAVITAYVLYIPYSNSYEIASYSGAVLSNNWFEALHWLRDNTPNCTVIATYWDPGHFITALAERPVVFDGASQNSVWTREFEGKLSQEEMAKIAVIPNYRYEYFEKDGKTYTRITTARIQDIGTSLLTSNETLAVNILRKFLIPGCNNSMYYIASGDLIGKSQWWTYFSTWSPQGHTGTKYYYAIAALYQTKPMLTDNATIYVYPVAQDQSFLIYEKDGQMSAYFQNGRDTVAVQKLFYFRGEYGIMQTAEDFAVEGLIWLSLDKSQIIFIPKELMDSMFTRMFLFNGEGLEKFQFVSNFGGEVKIFKVIFD